MSQKPNIVPKSLHDLSAASCEFGMCALPSASYAECLVVAFSGAAGNSHQHFGTFRYMQAMIAAGIAAWDPEAVVLDLTNLSYEWGDNMGEVLGTIPLPVVVVTSERNREGLTSLVEAELFERPRDWLFDTLTDALMACDRKYSSGPDHPPAARPAT